MHIDLNQSFTSEDVKHLLASKDDSQHRQLRVTKNGIAFLSDEVGNANTDNLAFRIETWDAKKDYVGEQASADSDWVKRVETILRDNWPNPTSSYIDMY